MLKRLTVISLLALSFIPAFAQITPIQIGSNDTLTSENTVFTHTPLLCVNGTQKEYEIAQQAMTEWQQALRNYTKTNSWNFTIQNHIQTNCSIFLLYSINPDSWTDPPVIGLTIPSTNYATIWIYSTEYWHDKIIYIKDKTNKLVPYSIHNAELNNMTLLHVSEHELGHALGIHHHNIANSIMVGADKIEHAKITYGDAREVVGVFGRDFVRR